MLLWRLLLQQPRQEEPLRNAGGAGRPRVAAAGGARRAMEASDAVSESARALSIRHSLSSRGSGSSGGGSEGAGEGAGTGRASVSADEGGAGSARSLMLAYDDGVLPAHNVARDQVPELDHHIVPALHRAARDGKLALLNALLQTEQSHVSARDAAHQTALHYACGSRRAEALSVVQALCARGADPNAKDALGSTPLHNAVRAGREDIARWLVQDSSGPAVNLNASDCAMDTPLHLAVRMRRERACEMLVRRGAILPVLNNANQTPLDMAKAGNQVALVELFLAHVDRMRIETYSLDPVERDILGVGAGGPTTQQ